MGGLLGSADLAVGMFLQALPLPCSLPCWLGLPLAAAGTAGGMPGLSLAGPACSAAAAAAATCWLECLFCLLSAAAAPSTARARRCRLPSPCVCRCWSDCGWPLVSAAGAAPAASLPAAWHSANCLLILSIEWIKLFTMSAERLAGPPACCDWLESDAADPEFLLLLLLLSLAPLSLLAMLPASAAASLPKGQAACSSAPTSPSMACTVSFKVFRLDLSACKNRGERWSKMGSSLAPNGVPVVAGAGYSSLK